MSLSSLSMVATTAASASSSLFNNLSKLSFSHTVPTHFSLRPKFPKPLKLETQNPNFASFSLVSLSPLRCAPATSIETAEENPITEEDEVEEQKEEDESVSESSEEGRLYVGNLPYSITSAQVAEVFGEAGQVANVEIVYDRVTDRSRGFAFVTMASVDDAKEAIRMFDGSQVGGRTVKVNFPEVPRGGERKVLGPKIRESYRAFVDSPHKIYAGNLGWRVTSETLREAFADQPGLLSTKVIYERDTGRSRGFGFVSFESANDVQAALNAMNGVEVEGRPLRLNLAAERAPSSAPASERDTENIVDGSELISTAST